MTQSNRNIIADTNEPPHLVTAMQQAVEVLRLNINDDNWADYRWHGAEFTHHWERKQWPEVLGFGARNHVTEQLQRQMLSHPEAKLGLVIEGMVMPAMGGTEVFHFSETNRLFVRNKNVAYSDPYSTVTAWLHQVAQYVEVQFTGHWSATAQFLVACYQNDQKLEHSTFTRHLKKLAWRPDPQIQMIMSVGRNIGEERAKALIKSFGTFWNVITATPEELATVPGIGLATARKLLQVIGRPDVV